jgi:hypothetical protein
MNIHPTKLLPKDVLRHFKIYFEQPLSSQSSDQMFNDNLYFVTIRFDTGRSQIAAPKQLKEFGRLHFRISRQLLGNHLKSNRKRKLQPLCYAFVDSEGSRRGSSDAFKCEMPHVHAVIMPPLQYNNEFKIIIDDPQLTNGLPIKSFDVRPYKSENGSLENLISYCMKGYRQAHDSHFLREELWGVFPN